LTIFSFLFAPLVTNKNPNFKKDLSVTKLLSPFSRVEILHLRNNEEFAADGKLGNLKRLKNKIVRKEFNENIIFADSIKNGSTVIYFQKDKPHKIDPSLCLQDENKVKISSTIFLFGSDELGRDIFTRIIYGTRISLLVGIGSLIIILALGVGLGFLSGLKGGLLNVILSRITDMFLYIPNIFLVILILALFGDSLQTVIIVLGLSGWMSLFKIVKSEVVALKNKDFIISSRKIGLSDKKLLYYEVLPVIAPPVIFTLISMFANIILAESSLSFLGLGGAGEYPSWGSMIHSGQEYLTHAWWMLIFPGSILVALLFSIHELGQKVRIRLNPRMQKYDK
jgi:peptide/nickel transport system permease protein